MKQKKFVVKISFYFYFYLSFKDLKTLILPHQTNLRNQIDEAIDLDIIKRRFEAKEADPHEYTKYFIDTMANLCAECRDEDITKLRTIDDPTDCFRFISQFF